MLQAQNWIHGKVVDKEERPVDGVAVVLQTLDSTYIDAVVTDSLGAFMLNKEAGPNYRLLFQHLLYEPVCKKISTADAGTISLTEKVEFLAKRDGEGAEHAMAIHMCRSMEVMGLG